MAALKAKLFEQSGHRGADQAAENAEESCFAYLLHTSPAPKNVSWQKRGVFGHDVHIHMCAHTHTRTHAHAVYPSFPTSQCFSSPLGVDRLALP